ncbi:MAG: hypothetical protein BMS9Abin12_2110 [Acidimicrobiia bacterium]|nr:MAG: hypothetical protein BMS9Abin12_2110 [Acidimicrobiia bacterium]
MTHEGSHAANRHSALTLSEWERGIVVTSADDPSVAMYLWFWEWNMFGAFDTGQHTHGEFENARTVATDGLSATIATRHGMSISLEIGAHGVDLDLNVTNVSRREWSRLASIVPCFSPGPEGASTEQFRSTPISFVGVDGFDRLRAREIHFNEELRAKVDAAGDSTGRFAWSDKWPTAHDNATSGLMTRASSDARWVTGIAWERFLSAQGNNPWDCMHLAVQIGPLTPDETRNVRGRIYLSAGTKEDLLAIEAAR